MTQVQRELVTTIDLSGPFFAHQPGLTFLQNVRRLMEAIAAEGEADVQAQLRAGEGSRRPLSAFYGGADRLAQHAIGRTHAIAERGGREWSTHAVISVNNSGLSSTQGISLMAASAEVEKRTHAFRNTARRIRSARALNTAELAKGLE
jgi:hypothetical protein